MNAFMTGASVARRPSRAKAYVHKLRLLAQKFVHHQAATPDSFESRRKHGLKTFELPRKADTRSPEQQLIDVGPEARAERLSRQRSRALYIRTAVKRLHKAIGTLPR